MQPKHIMEHLTGLLAATLAILFIIGVVYCIVYLDSFTTYARIQLTFVDVVNVAVITSSGPILLMSLALLSVLGFHFEKYLIASGLVKQVSNITLTIISSGTFLFVAAVFFSTLRSGLGAIWSIMTMFGSLSL